MNPREPDLPVILKTCTKTAQKVHSFRRQPERGTSLTRSNLPNPKLNRAPGRYRLSLSHSPSFCQHLDHWNCRGLEFPLQRVRVRTKKCTGFEKIKRSKNVSLLYTFASRLLVTQLTVILKPNSVHAYLHLALQLPVSIRGSRSDLGTSKRFHSKNDHQTRPKKPKTGLLKEAFGGGLAQLQRSMNLKAYP